MVPMLALFAIPSFVLIPILQWINYRVYRRAGPSLPAAGWGSPQNWVMPVIVLAAGNLGYIARLTGRMCSKSCAKTTCGRRAAKGLPERIVRNTHVLRNAMLPIVTVIGPAIAFLVTGAFVVESLFLDSRGRVPLGAGGPAARLSGHPGNRRRADVGCGLHESADRPRLHHLDPRVRLDA